MNNGATNNPIALSLELSQRSGSIAMSNSSGMVIEKNVDSGCQEQDEVMPSIEGLALELGVSPKSIGLIVISIGPGGFTGLRSAVAIAKMVAFVSGAAIIPIETALGVVGHANVGHGPFLVVSGVKKDRFWLSKVYKKEGRWFCESSPSTTSEMETSVQGAIAVFGDLYVPKSVVALCESRKVELLDAKTSAKSLLNLGLELNSEYQASTISPLELLPLYPREPEAVRVWKASKKNN